MKRFFGVPITRWASPRDRLHVYVLPGERLSAQLAVRQKALDGIAYCSTQPVANLHATVQQFALTTGEVPADRLAAFGDGLAGLALRTTPFSVPLGPPVVGEHTLGVRGHLTQRWMDLTAAIRELALATFHADVVLPAPPSRPHVSLGYGLAEGSSTVIQDRADGLHHGVLPDLRVDALHLLAVHQDEIRGAYTWDSLGVCALG
ncbi:2'-5' RNA ligase family protein [Pseudonocardia sp. GCM10023141]|uniref:2'-5' RNA ligase family protein n=1 Tax=Pseudonocardia sp. GCM10023141 TaxID=3252653 RepID=UPI00361E33CA